MAKNFRIYVNEKLELNKTITLDEDQTHYLKNVVKYTTNDTLLCFDNQTGEYICQITDLAKKKTTIQVTEKVKNLYICPDIWLLFAPLKKDKTDFVIEKATELGCRKIIPTITKYTITSNVKTSRYIAQSIEAAEQCRRTDIPEITEAMNIKELLQNWDVQRTLFFMDETLESKNFLQTLKENPTEKSAILVGPEGGFSEQEFEYFIKQEYKLITLGKMIYKAPNAVVAGVSNIVSRIE
jgi:16S rRNA (uracil1498-N3)-methyltransferase